MPLVKLKVMGLVDLPDHEGRTVFLREEGGEERILPIAIGPSEADAIRLELRHRHFQRPLSHDLLMNLAQAFKGQLERVTIVKLENSTFYAELALRTEDEELHIIDARPSDSIVLALKSKSDIYAAEEVLDQAGIRQDSATTEAILLRDLDARGIRSTPEEVRRAVEELTASVSPTPEQAGTELDVLERQQKAAIAAEDYERAAAIRDQIRTIEAAGVKQEEAGAGGADT